MFIIKVRDHITARTRELCSEGAYRLLTREDNKWRSCAISYGSYDRALAFVEKQIAQLADNNRLALSRDHRIFEQEGRKLKLIYEHLAEKEG